MLQQEELRNIISETKKRIVSRLMLFRITYQFSHEKLAELSGVPLGKIYNMEMGEELDIESITKIACVYNRKIHFNLNTL